MTIRCVLVHAYPFPVFVSATRVTAQISITGALVDEQSLTKAPRRYAAVSQTLLASTKTETAEAIAGVEVAQNLVPPSYTETAKAKVKVSTTQTLLLPTFVGTFEHKQNRHLSVAHTHLMPAQTAVADSRVKVSVDQTLLLPDNDIFVQRPPKELYVHQTLEPPTQVVAATVFWTPHEQGFGSQLLYRAATGLERAMADADSERVMAINAEAIKDVWDPYNIPLRLLPYLAWALGVNYWDDDWSEETKRAWVARQWDFKAVRGSERAVEIAVDYAGRDVSPFGYRVRSCTTPPQRIFSGPSLTKEQREAWLAKLPQIRVWRIQEPGTAPHRKSFSGGHNGLRQRDHRFCLGNFLLPSDAITRLKRRARWVVNETETDTTISEYGNYWRVHINSTGKRKVFCNRPFGLRHYYQPSDAAKRLVTVQPTPRLPWRVAVGPTLEPISAEPERVVVGGLRGVSVFSNTPISRKAFFMPSTASLRIYERYAVVGTPGPQAARPHVQFMGVGYYGWPKYTAWVSVSLSGKRPWLAAGAGIVGPRRPRFWIPHDPNPVQRGIAATKAAKRMVDRVLLDLGERNRWVAGGRPFLAEIDTLIVGRP